MRIKKRFQLMVNISMMIMFLAGTKEVDSLEWQQKTTLQAQASGRYLIPWYPYDKLSHYIFIKCAKFFLMFDMWGTSV